MYKALRHVTEAHRIFKKLWEGVVMPRYKIVFWLLLHYRINRCAICTLNFDEMMLHLFLDCPFALDCWMSLDIVRYRGISVLDEILLSMEVLPRQFALTIIIIGCWHIWMQRNGWIFQHNLPTVVSWRILLRKDLFLLIHKIKSKYVTEFKEWITACLS